MKEKLTRRKKAFCEEYLKDLNATQAAIRAGYSEKTARSIGAENLTKPDIKEYIEELQAEASRRNRITTDNLVNEFVSIKDDEIKNYVEIKRTRSGVKVFLKKNFLEMDTRNIQQLQVYPDGTVKNIKLYPRDNAIEQLGRHIGFFNDQLTLKNNLESVLKQLSNRDKLRDSDLVRIAEIIVEQQKKILKP